MQKLEGGDFRYPLTVCQSFLFPSFFLSPGSVCSAGPAIRLVLRWVLACPLQDLETYILRDSVTILARLLIVGKINRLVVYSGKGFILKIWGTHRITRRTGEPDLAHELR